MGESPDAGRFERWEVNVKAIFSNRFVILLSRLILGMVFIVASIDKIALPEAFAASIQAYDLLPIGIINILALVIPWMELLCGIFLVTGMLVRSSSAVVSVLLGVFVIAMVSALLRNLTIDCGCFGKAYATPVSWARVLEDAGLLLLGLHLFFFPYPHFSIENIEVPQNIAAR